MREAPAFWRRNGGRLLPALLGPFGAIAAAITARRVTRPGARAGVPVLCCGNVVVGGAGKTTLALDLLQRLTRRGVTAHALLRGYGGSVAGVHRVAPGDDARTVGDEALLLAEVAPTWTGADRAASARAAIAVGARALVLDDGLQNPTLAKDMSLLVIDGGFGFGNGRLLPAGPLRERVAHGAARCRAAVLIGADERGAVDMLPPALPVLRAALVPSRDAVEFAGRRVVAFSGIGRPGKFFASLEQVGAEVMTRHAFPDHHPFTPAELHRIETEAAQLGAVPVTTAKDAARLALADRGRFAVLRVGLLWESEAAIEALLSELLAAS